ncbi:MAG TPA: hypothetical protein VF692_06230 [Pyrinomonadaceae bacterium]|jgi:hypothetical protein
MAPRKQKNFQAFLKDDEWERFQIVFERAKQRFGRDGIKLSQSYVVRRLAGIDEPDDLVTPEDIAFFLNKESSPAQIVPQLSSASTDISETDTQPDAGQNKKQANGK